MSVESLTDQIRRRAQQNARLGYTVKFALAEDRVIRWDGTGAQPHVDMLDGPADTTIRISEEDLEKLLSGSLDPTLAYMTGKLRVEGSLGVAMKLTGLLGD
jgi:putative sterol carrier protein